VTPLAPDRFAVQLTISGATRDKLERARDLMRHKNPSGDLATLLDCALDVLVAQLEKKKFGATTRPRATKTRSRATGNKASDPSYVSAAVRRAVRARDCDQCTFVSASGQRCAERGCLEFDHITPVARGGQPTVENLRLRCRAHNHHAAVLAFGRVFMRDKRAEARVRRTAAAAAAPNAVASNADAPTATVPTNAAPTPAANVPTTAASTPVLAAPNTRALGPVPRPVHAATTDAASGDAERSDSYDHGERSPTAAQNEAVVTANSATAVASRAFDADVTDALRRLGFKAGDVRQAVAGTKHQPASTFEERIRSALAVLTRSRCSDGAFDELTRRWGASASSA
jgi:5-methylcytosine-specific restriction endonuclease McrA